MAKEMTERELSRNDGLTEIEEWKLHLDLHLSEHDESHAARALRAGWPHIRRHLSDVENERNTWKELAQNAEAKLRALSSETVTTAEARYRWLADKVIAPDYGDNDKGRNGYIIRHCKGANWIGGESLDAAIDAQIAKDRG